MEVKNLIGFQLAFINEEEIVVKKDNKAYSLKIINDEGDCCGYNDITAQLFISDTELSRNPVITNVTVEREEGSDGQSAKLVFFGEYKPMAQVETYSSSGSGWYYGATVTLRCEELEINEILSEY